MLQQFLFAEDCTDLDPSTWADCMYSVGRELEGNPHVLSLQLRHEKVSRKHCVFALNANRQITVTDTGSSHGTFVNGERLDRDPRVLSVGDVVSLVHSCRCRPTSLRPEMRERLIAAFVVIEPRATIIPLEEGWARLEAGLRRCEGFIFDGAESVSSADGMALYVTAYTMCIQKPPNNWSDELYQRLRTDAKHFSARTVARLAGKQSDDYVVALFDAWRGFELYAKFARERVFKYLDRFHVKRMHLPEIQEVVSLAFEGTLGLEATALSTSADDRGRDLALLRFVQARICLPAAQRVGPLEEKWSACFEAHTNLTAVAGRRRALALMLVLCAKNPPRAQLGDDPGRLSVVVRLAREGPFDQNGRSPLVQLILKKVTDEGARELVRAVEALLDATAAIVPSNYETAVARAELRAAALI